MTSITQQKSDLKDIILRRIKRSIDKASLSTVKRVAIGACQRLAARMTLDELRQWNTSLTLNEARVDSILSEQPERTGE